MNITAQYTADGSITATINGEALGVPDDPSNRHRQMIAEWEAEGNTIAAYVAPEPSTDPADYPLPMRNLRLGLKRLADKSASFILDTINAIPDADAKDEALIWYEETSLVHWDHPMTQTLMGLAGITPEQAAAMWLVAKDYE